jgi:hypothetical protein
VDPDHPIRLQQRHVRGYPGAEVAAVSSVPLVPQTLHQPVPQTGDERPVNACAPWALGEGVARQGRDHQVEPVAETLDQREQFDERAGPAVGEDQRRPTVGCAMKDEMDAHAVHVGDTVLETVEPPLLAPPVEPVGPVLEQVTKVVQVNALRPWFPRRRVRPARVSNALPQILDNRVRDLDSERIDAHPKMIVGVDPSQTSSRPAASSAAIGFCRVECVIRRERGRRRCLCLSFYAALRARADERAPWRLLCAGGAAEDRARSHSSGRAAKASLVSRYQSIDFLGWRQRLFMASRDSW